MSDFQNKHAHGLERAMKLQFPEIPNGAWYWVRFESANGMTDWTPAQRQGNHWNSASFSGIPMQEVEVDYALVHNPE
jgi:hypothetical protein